MCESLPCSRQLPEPAGFKGYKVAICEQMEDPRDSQRPGKKGCRQDRYAWYQLDTQSLDETKNNYIMCVVYIADRYGLSVADVTTGDYFVTELDDSEII